MSLGKISLLLSPVGSVLRLIPEYNDDIWFESAELVLFNIIFNKCEKVEDECFAKNSDILSPYDRLRLMRFIRDCGNDILWGIMLKHILLVDIIYDDAIDIMVEYLDIMDMVYIMYGGDAEIRNMYAKSWDSILRIKFPGESEVGNAGERLIILMGVDEDVLDMIVRKGLQSTDVMSVVERVVVVDGKNPFYELISTYMFEGDDLLECVVGLWKSRLSDDEYRDLLNMAIHTGCSEHIQILVDGILNIANFDFRDLIYESMKKGFYDGFYILLLANRQIIDHDLYQRWVEFRCGAHILKVLEERKEILLNGIGG